MRSFAGAVCAVLLPALLAASGAAADSLQVVHNFNGLDGQSPTGLLQAANGLFYGVGENGGDTKTCDPDGCGVIFSVDAAGTFTDLHVFEVTDGNVPTGLVEGQGGKLYGTTMLGGKDEAGGSGTIFSLTSGGKYKVVYRFTGGFTCCDGASPNGHLIAAADGKFYGTTMNGGAFRDFDHGGGFGTVYRFDPANSVVTVLHSFSLADGNGIFPNGPLLQGKGGLLYGTTREGGSGGGGTVFKIDMVGNFSLVAQLPGMEPLGGVIQTRQGDLYGTDDGGNGSGSLFRIDTAGQLSVLNRFDGADGKGPNFELTRGTDGFFYGTAQQGGLLDAQGGAVFRLSANGDYRVLHSFASAVPQGIFPNATLIEASDGFLYGTAALGGTGTRGTVFRIDPADLGPVASVSVHPATVSSGSSVTGKVKLFAPAPAQGLVVMLRAQPGPVTVPQSVKVRAGKTTATFTIDTMKIGAENNSHIYASVQGQGVRTVIRVVP